MKEAVTPGPAKALWQDMEHEEIKEIFSGDGPGPVFPGPGMKIPVGDTAILASEDILFPDYTPVQIPAEIDQGLVTGAHVLAVNNPLPGTVFGHAQAVVNHGLKHLCPEDLCQGLVAEEVPGMFDPP